ncbi:MAG: hypothetical protein H6672_16650 [Anaerolineaceae bacterium]|nr:hypothetical protein [Anaerolineaceae bacterium]
MYKKIAVFVLFLFTVLISGVAQAQSTAFVYHGYFTRYDGNQDVPVTDTCTFRFKLFDALTGGTQLGRIVTERAIEVQNGNFSVELDFGINVFDGVQRYLEIAVRCPGTDEFFVTLTPRFPLTPYPNTIYPGTL